MSSNSIDPRELRLTRELSGEFSVSILDCSMVKAPQRPDFIETVVGND
jgi:hypothetical protein